jgi:predicted transcriptional regulator
MSASPSLGPLEQRVMNYIWKYKLETVREVYDRLKGERPAAYTTIMTIMSRLVDKGQLERVKKGKTYYYKPQNTKRQTVRSLVRHSFQSLVNQFGSEAVTAFSDEVEKLSDQDRQLLDN